MNRMEELLNKTERTAIDPSYWRSDEDRRAAFQACLDTGRYVRIKILDIAKELMPAEVPKSE